MTNGNGSATQVAADAGTPDPATGDGAPGSIAIPADPFSGLDAGTREWVGTKGYKSVGDLALAARNAESLIGRSVQLPGDDAKSEDWDKVFGRLGRPDKPDGYELKLPEGLPEGMPIDEAFTSSFRDAAHKAGLTARQAAALHDWYVGASAGAFTAQSEATVATAAQATQELEKAFGGAKDSDAFKAAIGITNRALKELGGEELIAGMKAAGLLSEEGVVLNSAIALAFHRAGKALYSEDALVKGAPDTANNPFREGFGQGNLTDQMTAIRKDRDAAIRLIQLAGHDPASWLGPDWNKAAA